MNIINVELNVKDQLCLDLLTTCVEGSSFYWLACDRVERDANLNVTKIIGCVDADDDTTKWPDADLDTIREGIRRILSGETKVRADIAQQVLQAVLDADATDWDAEVADCVLQAGLLKDIVYG